MMNRERMARNRMTSTGTTSLGLDERMERTLIYPISFLFGWLFSFFFGWGWLFVVVPGLILLFLEKNRNIRFHARQSMVIFGSFAVLLTIVNLLKFLLGFIPVIHILTGLVLGLVGAVIVWVMVLLLVWLVIRVFFQPTYRLPFIGKYLGY